MKCDKVQQFLIEKLCKDQILHYYRHGESVAITDGIIVFILPVKYCFIDLSRCHEAPALDRIVFNFEHTYTNADYIASRKVGKTNVDKFETYKNVAYIQHDYLKYFEKPIVRLIDLNNNKSPMQICESGDRYVGMIMPMRISDKDAF